MKNAIQIDAQTFSRKLRMAWADEELAEAIDQRLAVATRTELATKEELAEIRRELDARLAEIRGEFRAETAKLEARITQLANRMTYYQAIGLLALLFIITRLLPSFGVGG